MSRVFNRFGFFAFLGEKPKGGMLYVDLYLFWRVVVDVCCVNKKKEECQMLILFGVSCVVVGFCGGILVLQMQ